MCYSAPKISYFFDADYADYADERRFTQVTFVKNLRKSTNYLRNPRQKLPMNSLE